MNLRHRTNRYSQEKKYSPANEHKIVSLVFSWNTLPVVRSIDTKTK